MAVSAVTPRFPLMAAVRRPWLAFRACAAGELRHTRIGSAIRIAPEDLEAFVARGRGPPA